MGIADRFKIKLEKKNIFEKLNSAEHQSVSDPITNNSRYTYENLETQIIDKIRKTPYWNDFTTIEKENMISSYFYKKTADKTFGVTEEDCKDFVKTIIDLT